MEELVKDKETSLKYYLVLKEYENMFRKLLGFPPNRESLYFSIDLMPEAAPMSKTPYIMSTPTLK
jgi:CTP-dependent riboflavin kinase